MSELVRVAAVDEVPPGTGKEVAAAGRVVALFNIDGRFYALDGVCAHAGGPLGKGAIRGTVVTCPWHGWQYDATSGRHCLNDRVRQTAFPVKVEGGDVYVEIP